MLSPSSIRCLKPELWPKGVKRPKARPSGRQVIHSAQLKQAETDFFLLIFKQDGCCFPEFIQPVKVRPKTDCAVAQRMVTRALGLQKGSRVQRY